MRGPKERWVQLPTQSPTEPKQPFQAKPGWLHRIEKTTRPEIDRHPLLTTALGSSKARRTRPRTPSTQRLEEISRALSCAKHGNGSDPWADVSQKISAERTPSQPQGPTHCRLGRGCPELACGCWPALSNVFQELQSWEMVV